MDPLLRVRITSLHEPPKSLLRQLREPICAPVRLVYLSAKMGSIIRESKTSSS
jgi:hypothetical protein